MTCGSGSVIGKCDEGGYASYVFETANKGYLPAAAMAPYTKTVAAEDRVFCEDPDPSADALARIASSISYRTKPTKAGEGEEDDHVANFDPGSRNRYEGDFRERACRNVCRMGR